MHINWKVRFRNPVWVTSLIALMISTVYQALAMFEDDYVTRSMIQEFIVDEQDHFNWVRQHLNLMQEIGMENYLIEQLGE